MNSIYSVIRGLFATAGGTRLALLGLLGLFAVIVVSNMAEVLSLGTLVLIGSFLAEKYADFNLGLEWWTIYLLSFAVVMCFRLLFAGRKRR